MRTLTFAGAFAIGLVAASAAHPQATIDECEKIQAADAYNQCLAKFGPTSKLKNLEPEKPGDIKGSSEEAAAAAGPLKRGGRHAGRRRGGHAAHKGSAGRKRMTIGVGRRRHR